jgi:hypothetical protein
MIDDANLQRLVRTPRWAAFLSLLVFVVLIAGSAYELAALQKASRDARRLNKELDSLNTQLKQDIAEKRKELNRKDDVISWLNAPSLPPSERRAVALKKPEDSFAERIKPMARATPRGYRNPDGKQVYDFALWVAAPDSEKAQISEVRYEFNHPSFDEPSRVQQTPMTASRYTTKDGVRCAW